MLFSNLQFAITQIRIMKRRMKAGPPLIELIGAVSEHCNLVCQVNGGAISLGKGLAITLAGVNFFPLLLHNSF